MCWCAGVDEDGNYGFAIAPRCGGLSLAPICQKCDGLRFRTRTNNLTIRPAEQALKLQRPLPDGTLKIVATGEKEDPIP